MTNRILSMGFAMTVAAMGLLGGCGTGESTQEPPFTCPEEDQTDFDNDGVRGSVTAYEQQYENELKNHACQFPDDWCPTFAGPAERHGCPSDMLGDSCDKSTKGLINQQLVASIDESANRTQQVYPEKRFCVYHPDDTLKLTSGFRIVSGTLAGTWVKFDPKIPIQADGYVSSKVTTLIWRKKDGSSGSVTGDFGSYPFVPVPGPNRLVLPVDGTLATLEINDPAATLWLWTMGGQKIPCTEKNAAGGPVCRF